MYYGNNILTIDYPNFGFMFLQSLTKYLDRRTK
jgi:hypothetical protein